MRSYFEAGLFSGFLEISDQGISQIITPVKSIYTTADPHPTLRYFAQGGRTGDSTLPHAFRCLWGGGFRKNEFPAVTKITPLYYTFILKFYVNNNFQDPLFFLGDGTAVRVGPGHGEDHPQRVQDPQRGHCLQVSTFSQQAILVYYCLETQIFSIVLHLVWISIKT